VTIKSSRTPHLFPSPAKDKGKRTKKKNRQTLAMIANDSVCLYFMCRNSLSRQALVEGFFASVKEQVHSGRGFVRRVCLIYVRALLSLVYSTSFSSYDNFWDPLLVPWGFWSSSNNTSTRGKPHLTFVHWLMFLPLSKLKCPSREFRPRNSTSFTSVEEVLAKRIHCESQQGSKLTLHQFFLVKAVYAHETHVSSVPVGRTIGAMNAEMCFNT